MTNNIVLHINNQPVEVLAGTTVAIALFNHTTSGCSRHSVSGQIRTPFCGMGVCHECRVFVNGVRKLACQTLCDVDMQVMVTR